MITQKKQDLKRFTYICLSLTSIILSSGVQAMNDSSENEVDYHVNGGYIPLPRLGKTIADELEGPNHIGAGSKLFESFEDKVQEDLRKSPQGGKALRKTAKQAAKGAAIEAARNAAYSFLNDVEEAEHIVKSIMKGCKLKEKKDPREARLLHLGQSYAMNAARVAAEETAYNILKDERKALKVVHSLKLGKYAKRENPKGGKAARPSPAVQKFKTLNDLKLNEKEDSKRQATSSPLNQAKIATELGTRTVKTSFEMASFLKKLVK